MTTGTTASGTFYSYIKKDQEIPIVFVHGVGLTHEIWKPQLDFFNNYSTLAYDILGHGKSSLDKEIISFDDFSNQLIDLIKYKKNSFGWFFNRFFDCEEFCYQSQFTFTITNSFMLNI